MTKQTQLKNNEDIFVNNQRIIRDLYNRVQIGKSDLQKFSQWNVKQFEDARNKIIFNEVK